MKTKIKLVVLAILVITIACNRNQEQAVQRGINLNYIDTTVKPVDDFFQYANGGWLKTAQIPASKTGWGAFDELTLKGEENQRQLLEEIAKKKNEPNSVAQKVGDLYFLGMDSVRLNQEGAKPLEPLLQRIAAIQDKKQLLEVVAYLQQIGCNVLWNGVIEQDLKENDRYSFYVSQGGLGISNRDYYTKTDIASKKIQQAYNHLIQKMFQFLGEDSIQAKKDAEIVYSLEKKLAFASMTRLELRNIETQYNKMSIQQLTTLAPIINWNDYMQLIGLSQVKEIIVAQPLFMKEVNQLMKSVSINDWKIYLRWRVINSTSHLLSDEIMHEEFDFYDKTLQGRKEIRPRWQRCLEVVNQNIGEGLGQVYVEKYFSKEAKNKINEIVDNITAVFKERIQDLDWMSDSTKAQALLKLKAIHRKLGYPDKWKDYSKLIIQRDLSYVQNILRANEFHYKKELEKMGKPVDKTEWPYPPQTVNAGYLPITNEIVFPAGILQPPFFNAEAEDAYNYGSIGLVIGHELTHGFDDMGSKFDLNGNFKNWWLKEDQIRFEEKTQLLVNQYNQFAPIDTFHVNGKLTLGENIADLGGVTIAYQAFQRSLKGKEKSEKIQGFTPEQRFFLSCAQIWRRKQTDERIKYLLTVDVHSPEKARVNIVLSNIPAFYDAFGVKPGDKMYRDEKDRAKIW